MAIVKISKSFSAEKRYALEAFPVFPSFVGFFLESSTFGVNLVQVFEVRTLNN